MTDSMKPSYLEATVMVCKKDNFEIEDNRFGTFVVNPELDWKAVCEWYELQNSEKVSLNNALKAWEQQGQGAYPKTDNYRVYFRWQNNREQQLFSRKLRTGLSKYCDIESRFNSSSVYKMNDVITILKRIYGKEKV